MLHSINPLDLIVKSNHATILPMTDKPSIPRPRRARPAEPQALSDTLPLALFGAPPNTHLRQYRLALASWLGRPVSQAELARAIGCRRQYVWAMEAGRRPVSGRAAAALGRWAAGLEGGRELAGSSGGGR